MKIDYTDYYIEVMKEREKYPELRFGQVLFNVLWEMFPEIAERIRSTDADPFYATDTNDPRIAAFKAALEIEWKGI